MRAFIASYLLRASLLACLVTAVPPLFGDGLTATGTVTVNAVPVTDILTITFIDNPSNPGNPTYTFEDSWNFGMVPLGSIVLQPPQISLPPGADVVTALLWWSVAGTFDDVFTNSVVPVDPTQPYSASFLNAVFEMEGDVSAPGIFADQFYNVPNGYDFGTGSVADITNLVRAHKPLPPVTADMSAILWGGHDEHGENSVTTITRTLNLRDLGSSVYITVDYSLAPVPEPSTVAMVVAGLAVLGASRFRIRRG